MRKRVLIVVAVVLAAVLSGCTLWGEKRSYGWKSATSGEQLDRLLWDGISKARWTEVTNRVAPLAVYNEAGESVTGRDAVISRWKTLEIKDAQVGEVETQPAGAELVTTYRVAIGGGKFLRAMSVWQQTKSGWILIAHSTSSAQ